MRLFIHRFASRNLCVQRRATLRTFTMSASNSTSSPSSNQQTNGSAALSSESPVKTQKETLALPEAPHDTSRTTTLDLSNGSTSIALDHLGPMVVNVDGTLSRISNWDNMADIEKENTLRIIGKRNQARLKVLREQEAVKAGDDSI